MGNTTYEYDDKNNQVASVDSKGRRTKYEYDDRGNMVKTVYADGTFEEFTYDANGNNITATDRLGLTVTMNYDKLDRVSSMVYPDGTKQSYEYDAVGNVVTSTSVSGAKTTYEYDTMYRNTAITDGLGNTTRFEYNESSKLVKVIDAKNNEIAYSYDDNGNRTKVTYADGVSVESVYDARGRITVQKDEYGNETHYEYDGADRLVKVTDAYGSNYQYSYDGNGNLIRVEDANGNVTTYEYDSVGRVKTLKNSLGKTRNYQYDATGNVTEYKDYAGNVTKYTYDAMDYLIETKVNDETTKYQYNDKHQLVQVEDKTGVIVYDYDTYGRLSKKVDSIGNSLEYIYDEYGRLDEFETSYGSTNYEYDMLDRVTRVVDRNGQATVYEYDELGNRIALTYANGVVVSYTYDACQRLKEEWVCDKDGNTIAKYAYTLGKAGERTTIEETVNGETTVTDYTYDKLLRLVSEKIQVDGATLINDYSYDKVSNRSTKKVTVKGDLTKLADIESDDIKIVEGTTTYEYNGLNQLIVEESSQGIITNVYDDNGNLIKQTGDKNVDYSYDEAGRLRKATIQKGNDVTIESYTYDYAGNRITKEVNEEAPIYYVVDTSGALSQVVAECTADREEQAYYTRGQELLSMERDSKSYYYVYDGHGSVRALTDQSGTVTDTYDYDAYGNLLSKTGTTENDYLYVGEQYNASTGLYYLRARYMDPSTGTFISMDSYSGSNNDPITLHKYLYANANPVVYTDPSGYFSIMELQVTKTIQSTLDSMTQCATFMRVLKWANVVCTVYDVAMEIRNVILGGGTIGDVIFAIAKGVAVGIILNGVCNTALGVVLKPMLAIFGLGSQVDLIQEAIEKGDPIEITMRFAQLVVMIFTLGTQCFTGETLVSTEAGLRPIEDIQVGDYVWSEDTETGEKSLKKVLDVIVSETDVVVHIATEENEITTTQNHPFYVEGKGWIAASELQEGDVLHTKEGITTFVQSVEVEQLDEAVTVYNLEVEDGHTYYVTDERVLVHNKCGNSGGEEGSGSTKPNQEHHFATNKSKKYTSQFENIANKYGLDLDGAWNKEIMPHQGRHPYAYHDYILDNIQKFDKIAKGDTNKFLKLFEQMKNIVIDNPDMLYKEYWKNK